MSIRSLRLSAWTLLSIVLPSGLVACTPANPGSQTSTQPSMIVASIADETTTNSANTAATTSRVATTPLVTTSQSTSGGTTLLSPLPTTPSATTSATGAVATPVAEPGRNHQVASVLFDRGMLPLGQPGAETLTRSWGVVSAPTDAPGPFPLVVVLHGAHSFCAPPDSARAWPCSQGPEERNQDGLSYLTEALARSGFVAIALGINAEYAQPGLQTGEVVAATIERDVIAPLRTGTNIGFLSASRVDASGVVLVGHSRGAAIASVLGLNGDVRRLTIPVRANVMLAPPTDAIDPNLLADVPTAIVIGGCDSDTGIDGGSYLTTPTASLRRSALALVLINRATHNATNSLLGPDSGLQGRPGCDEPLSAREQRQHLEDLVPETVRALVGLEAVGNIGTTLIDPTRR